PVSLTGIDGGHISIPLKLTVDAAFFFFFQAEDGIRDRNVTGVQTCALPISFPALARACRGGVRSGGGDRGVRGAGRRGGRAGTMGRRPGVVQPRAATRRGRERRPTRRQAGAAPGRAGAETARPRRRRGRSEE